MLARDRNTGHLQYGTHDRDLLVQEGAELGAFEENVLNLVFFDVLFPAWRLDQAYEEVFPISGDITGNPRRRQHTSRVCADRNVGQDGETLFGERCDWPHFPGGNVLVHVLRLWNDDLHVS